MARTRTGSFKALHEMNVGAEMAIPPDPGEDVSHLLKRLRARLAKWSKDGLAYRFKVDSDEVVVQRLPNGRTAKYADWWSLELGEALILKARPAEGDWKRAKAAENYINSVRRDRESDRLRAEGVSIMDLLARPTNLWEVTLDRFGRLIVLRVVKDSKVYRTTGGSLPPIKEPWAGDWL